MRQNPQNSSGPADAGKAYSQVTEGQGIHILLCIKAGRPGRQRPPGREIDGNGPKPNGWRMSGEDPLFESIRDPFLKKRHALEHGIVKGSVPQVDPKVPRAEDDPRIWQ